VAAGDAGARVALVTVGALRFVYDPALAGFELASEHPFKPLRYELTYDLLRASGVLGDDEVVAPRALDEAALLAVHDERYVRAVKAASAAAKVTAAAPPAAEVHGQLSPGLLASHGLGSSDNPIFAGMHEMILGVCAATVTAIDLVASGQALRATNFAGGLHHALRAKASGFCVYNDIAVGIRRAVDRYGLRVAYVDLDAHHGDGVQWLFYDDPNVMTISLHESGRYLFPGTGHTYETGQGAGRGSAVNLPLEPFTEDDSYLASFDRVVPRALESFKPDLIVLQAGADTHRHDPLADLALSLAGMSTSYQRVVELADLHSEGRLVVTGGGGYDPYRTVPRAWALAWSALSGRALPLELPSQWRTRWQDRLGVELPTTFAEDVSRFPPIPRREAITRRNRSVAERLMNTIEPLWATLPADRGRAREAGLT